MKNFLFKIANKYARWSLSIWTLFFVFEVLVTKYLKIDLNVFGSLLGFGMALFISSMSMNQTQWTILWRRTSETIRQFWAGILAILVFNLVLNGICWLAFRLYKGNVANLHETVLPET